MVFSGEDHMSLDDDAWLDVEEEKPRANQGRHRRQSFSFAVSNLLPTCSLLLYHGPGKHGSPIQPQG